MYTLRNTGCKEEESTIEKIVVIEKYSPFVLLRSLRAGAYRERDVCCVCFCFTSPLTLSSLIFHVLCFRPFFSEGS